MKVLPDNNFFTRRWRGQTALSVMLWRDMLSIGTLTMTILALATIAMEGHIGLAVVLNFSPLPYNLFLVLALWRAPGFNAFSAVVASGWFALMIVL